MRVLIYYGVHVKVRWITDEDDGKAMYAMVMNVQTSHNIFTVGRSNK